MRRALLLLPLVVVPQIAVAGAAPAKCLGRTPTITGGSGRVVRGTSGPDVIVAWDGHYVVKARGGDDVVCADPSNDTVFGGRGDDDLWTRNWYGFTQMHGGPGADRLSGGGGRKHGGPGDDHLAGEVLLGGPGDDVLLGWDDATVSFAAAPGPLHVDLRKGIATGFGKDRLRGDVFRVYGGRFDDVLIGDDSSVELHGMGGSDRLVGGAGEDWLDGDADRDLGGDDDLRGGRGGDSLTGGFGDDVLHAGPGWDDARGDAGNDRMVLGEGNDVSLGGTPGDDHVLAGPGVDTVCFSDSIEPLEIDLAAGWAEGAGSDVIEDVEHTCGGWDDDVIRGTEDANVVHGGEGNDRIYGLGGDDDLWGEGGIDVVDGGEGSDGCDAETPVSCERPPDYAERA